MNELQTAVIPGPNGFFFFLISLPTDFYVTVMYFQLDKIHNHLEDKPLDLL